MCAKRLLRWCFSLTLLALMAPWLGAVSAQEAAGPPEAGGAAAAVAEPGPGDAADQEKPLREQTIYVPYEELRKIFEREGRGVFLPYEKFQELWQAARQQTAPAKEPRPPVGAVIAQADSEATVKHEIVSVVARLKIEVLAEGWHEVPLRLGDAAIRSATIGGAPARIVPGEDGYKLLIKSEKGDAKELELQLDYVKAFSKSPGQNSVSFQAPQAPVNRWTIRIPESGVKVNVSPMIAATEVPAAAPLRRLLCRTPVLPPRRHPPRPRLPGTTLLPSPAPRRKRSSWPLWGRPPRSVSTGLPGRKGPPGWRPWPRCRRSRRCAFPKA